MIGVVGQWLYVNRVIWSSDGALFGMLLWRDLFIDFLIIRKVWIQSFDYRYNTLPHVWVQPLF